MKEQPPVSIYDERLDDVYNTKKAASAPSKAVTKSTDIREYTPAPAKRRLWAGPIIDRENLVDRLNELERLDYVIFTILTISVAKVQVMCYLEIDDEEE